MAYIYKITNDINNKVYIGKTVKSIEKRWKEHCIDSKKTILEKRPLYSAIKKYGIEHFHIEQIEECNENNLSDREIYWIEQYGSFKNGYNATLGGEGKKYVDYDMVEYNYKIYQNMKKVAEIMNISTDTVSYVLKERKIPVKTTQQMNKEKFGIPVTCYNKKTKEIIKTFSSIGEAANWLIDNKLTNCKFNTIRYHISEVKRGKRKSTAGFIWK